MYTALDPSDYVSLYTASLSKNVLNHYPPNFILLFHDDQESETKKQDLLLLSNTPFSRIHSLFPSTNGGFSHWDRFTRPYAGGLVDQRWPPMP